MSAHLLRNTSSFEMPWLALVLLASGCITQPHPDMTKLVCKTDNQCPDGYTCKFPGQPGGCCKDGDSTCSSGKGGVAGDATVAGSPDSGNSSAPTGGALGTDAATGDTGAWMDTGNASTGGAGISGTSSNPIGGVGGNASAGGAGGSMGESSNPPASGGGASAGGGGASAGGGASGGAASGRSSNPPASGGANAGGGGMGGSSNPPVSGGTNAGGGGVGGSSNPLAGAGGNADGGGANGGASGTGGSSSPPATGGTITPDAAVPPPDGPTADAPGTCTADKDCTSAKPLCLGLQCAKCTADSDCTGRTGTPACATASGLCVACTANRHCTGAANTCDTTTNQCVGCVTRSDCAGECQTCTGGVCKALKNQDDPGVCAGICDSSGACKSKQGQTCQTASGGCMPGTTCSPDGVCCDTACGQACHSCLASKNGGKDGTCGPVSDGTSCGTSGQHCTAGTCATPKGGTCSTTAQCAQGSYCTDGVCCAASSCGTCRACDVTGSEGTCSPVAQGTADPACPASTANCMYGGCNGYGACQPSPAGTVCGAVCTNDQSNGVVAGQWYTPSTIRNKKCNGSTAGAAGCVTDTSGSAPYCGVSGAPGLVCASPTACKTSCFVDSDCAFSYYCNAGTCTSKGGTSCSSAIQCSNGACTGSQVQPVPHCAPCVNSYTCPITAPNCQLAVGTPGCIACDPGYESCNSDGSINCSVAGSVCPSNAPNCGADNHCHCGTGAQCLHAGEICVSGQCKMRGGWPCVNSGDCAYGSCANGVCPPTPSGGLCTGLLMIASECANGDCSDTTNKCP